MVEIRKTVFFASWMDRLVHYGPGYRVYFTRRGQTLIVLLCGGDKKTQGKDIKTAKMLAADLGD